MLKLCKSEQVLFVQQFVGPRLSCKISCPPTTPSVSVIAILEDYATMATEEQT